ncbi:MAG: SRPBCC family protein [Microthrixaceae bacterium]
MSTEQQVSVSRTIHADADAIFDVLAHPARHADIDGSGTVQASRGEQGQRLEMGSKFGMDMRMGLPYRINNTVVEFEEGRRIGWRHMGRHVWRYELEPTDEGTVVTESFDWSGALPPVKAFIKLMGYPDKHPVDMEATLERLAELTEGTEADQAE